MNRILKIVVGAVAVSFACGTGGRATEQQNVLYGEYMKVISGERQALGFIENQLIPRETKAQTFFNDYLNFMTRLERGFFIRAEVF